MNHKKGRAFLFPFIALVLTGCNVIHSPSSGSDLADSVSASVATKKSLVISSEPTRDYFVGQAIDLSGLVVLANTYEGSTLISSEQTTEYTLRITDTGKVITDGYIFTEAGDYDISVLKEGYESTSFLLFIDDVTDYKESLIITSYPKTGYQIGEAFSSDGLVVKKKVSYKTDKTYTSLTDVSDYVLKIDNPDGGVEDVDNYTFSSIGSYKVWVVKGTLDTSFQVSVAGQSHLASLTAYNDSSISWTTDTDSATIQFTNPNKTNAEGDKGYISPDEIGTAYTTADYSKKNVYNQTYTPTTGKVPLLVVPVITPGDSSLATEENWNLIYKCFFGDSDQLNFESLHSYYYKSSFHQLDFTGGVTGFFDPTTVSNSYSNTDSYTSANIAALAQLAATWAEDNYGIDPKDYDSNGDGYIDGMWMIYLHKVDSSTDFWAYTTSTEANANVNSPVVNTFGWASINFLNDNFAGRYYTTSDNSAADAHVLIHETGHMLGLADYYSYNSNSGYAPLGRTDMMDNNVGDHNPYSKLLYGWVKPYIVTGNATITIHSSQYQNNVIVIPYDSKTYTKEATTGKYTFNPYDEYLVLELYNDNNLNAQDYDCYSVTSLKASGIRLYHADARLFTVSGLGLNYSFTLPDDPDSVFTGTDQVINIISNTESGTRAESTYLGSTYSTFDKYDELRWISANGTKLSSYNTPSSSSLFKLSGTSSFSLSHYSSQFNTSTRDGTTYYLNNGKAFSTAFTITAMSLS